MENKVLVFGIYLIWSISSIGITIAQSLNVVGILLSNEVGLPVVGVTI